MRLGPPPEEPEEPGQFWKDFIRETAPVFRKPTIEQLAEFIEPTFRALCDGARYVDDRLREIFDELQPDVIVEDNVVFFPAIHGLRAAVGAHRLVQPARDQDPDSRRSSRATPGRRPHGLGRVPRRSTTAHRRSARRVRRVLRRAGRRALSARRVHARVGRGSTSTSYPGEADYRRSTPLGPTWHRLDSCVRAHRRDLRRCPSSFAAGKARSSTCRSAASARRTSP